MVSLPLPRKPPASSTAAVSTSFALLERQRAVFHSVLSRPITASSSPGSATIQWKVLVCDSEARTVVETLFSPVELRSYGVTLHATLSDARGRIPNTPALYIAMPTAENLRVISSDLSNTSNITGTVFRRRRKRQEDQQHKPMYDYAAAAFLTSISPDALAQLAASIPVPAPLSTVLDMHARFIAFEHDLFSLGMHKSFARSDVDTVVDGLFSVLLTLGAVPVIRCPDVPGRARDAAVALDARIRRDLSLFQRSPLAGRALSFRRPVLLLVDRSFDCNPVLYHTWTYQALVHDCLGTHLNKVTIDTTKQRQGGEKQTYTLSKADDPFWAANASAPFPVVAENVEAAVKKYRTGVEAVSSNDATKDSDSLDEAGLAGAIASLPELARQKELINVHTNIATSILENVNRRSLDTFFELESQLVREASRSANLQSPDAYKAAITKLLTDTIKSASNGDDDDDDDDEDQSAKRGRWRDPVRQSDRLRMFLIYYDIFGGRFSARELREYKQLFSARMDTSIIDYFGTHVKQFEHEHPQPQTPKQSVAALNTATLTRLMNRMVHRGYRSINTVAQNAKKLVTDAPALFRVARVLEQLVSRAARDRAPDLLDGFLVLDPKLGDGDGAEPARERLRQAVYRDAIVFTVGGGNYVEYESCRDAVAAVAGPAAIDSPNVLYGTTEMLTADAFLEQLASLSGTPAAQHEQAESVS